MKAHYAGFSFQGMGADSLHIPWERKMQCAHQIQPHLNSTMCVYRQKIFCRGPWRSAVHIMTALAMPVSASHGELSARCVFVPSGHWHGWKVEGLLISS